jgi:tRNA pseudouridine32 synthase/23S rRNA pseudouridine746 synthase
MHADSSQTPFDPGRGAPDTASVEARRALGPEFPPELPTVIAATDRYVVIDKPTGMLSVPGKGPEKAHCAVARIAARFRSSGPLVVHRLDMETSGLMVFGLDEEAQRELSAQFEERRVEKTYTALVVATLHPSWSGAQPDRLIQHEGTISLPIRGDLERRPLQIVDTVDGREAVTHWRVLSREIDRVRILFKPITGRTHQIRVHAASGLGHPIIGDELYGGPEAPRLMLHATSLSFLEPGSARRVEFTSAAPF